MILPSGEQVVLRSGEAEATVVEVGGGLRTYRWQGREILDGYAAEEMSPNARGHVLAPWPNRLRDGRYTWEGQEYRTPVTEPEQATAIHGLVRFVAWRVVERGPDQAVLEYLLHPQPGYPFTLRLRVGYVLSPDGLQVTTTATNEGDRPLPYGEGHHPYLAAGPGLLLDNCTLEAPGATRLETDRRGIPTQAVSVENTPYDLRGGRRIGNLAIDHCFTNLERRADGLAWTRLTDPDGRGAAVWMDRAFTHLQLFTGDSLPESRRRRGLAVEPMTCAPDALGRRGGVRRLGPGESATTRWGIQPFG